MDNKELLKKLDGLNNQKRQEQGLPIAHYTYDESVFIENIAPLTAGRTPAEKKLKAANNSKNKKSELLEEINVSGIKKTGVQTHDEPKKEQEEQR